MIKFDHEKVNFANSDRIESSDPEFLTFRNNGQNNTGRSVFSQKIEIYKSLEKNNQEEFSDEEEETPVRNFKKTNHLRALRSQEKNPSRPYTPVRKLREEELNKREKIFVTNNNNSNKNEELANEITVNQYEFKNELLKKKIQKIVKSIKNEQRREESLERDIEELQEELEDDNKQIENKLAEIEELEAISQQNQTYLEKLTRTFEELEMKNDHLESLVEKIEDSLENLLSISRQEDSKTKMAQKLKEGLVKLESLKLEVTNRCIRIESEIVKMKELIEQTDNLDLSIRDTAYNREAENNSHFTC